MSLPIYNIATFGTRYNVGAYALSYAGSLRKIMTSIFKYEGLPEGVESWMIEQILFFRGEAAFFKVGEQYVITPLVRMDWNLYNLTTIASPIPYNGKGPNGSITLISDEVIISNLKNKYKKNNTKAVFFINNISRQATLKPIVGLLKFLQNTWVELNYDRKNSRNINVISAGTPKEAKTIKKEMGKVYYNNEPFVVLSNSTQDLIKNITKLNPNNTPRSTSLWDDFVKAKQEINELVGIPFDSRPEKKERVITQEVNISQIQTNEILQEMLIFRQRALKEIEKVFNLKITVSLDEKIEAAFGDNQEQAEAQNNNNQGDNDEVQRDN